MRTHPPALQKLVERTLREESGVGRGDRVLVAVSGGADSMALLHVLARLAPRLGFKLSAHGVDHGLRPEAAAELDLAAAMAQQLGVPFERTRVGLAAGSNLQARARGVRYEALGRAADRAGGALIATAHQADDRAETVLMRLLGGAGPRGLAVLPPRAGNLIRPLVRARRSAIESHLARHGIKFANDPSNEDRRFLRVRVRREIMPLLESLSPAVVEHLCALADQLAEPQPPVVLDEAGNQLVLGRAQTAQLRRAQRLGLAGVRIPLRGGRVLGIDSRTGAPLLCDSAPPRPRRRDR